MSDPARIAAMTPRDAYLAGFAEAARRIEAHALHLRGAPLHDADGPFLRGLKLNAETIALHAGTIQPEGAP